MRFLKTLILLFTSLICLRIVTAKDNFNDKITTMGQICNWGQDFYLTFLPSNIDDNSQEFKIIAFSNINTNIKISVPRFNFEKDDSLIANEIYEFSIPKSIASVYRKADTSVTKRDTLWRDAAIHIQSDDPIICYGLNIGIFTNEGFAVYPTHTLGKEYIVASWNDPSDNINNYFPCYVAVIAINDKTKVNFIMGGNDWSKISSGLYPGESNQWTIDKGDVLLISSMGAYSDLSCPKELDD